MRLEKRCILLRKPRPEMAAPVSGLESINRAGVNVLVDDYWDLYEVLLK